MYEVSETTTDAARIQRRRRRLRHRDDKPGELSTTTESLAEEYEPEDWMTATEMSAEEAEETTCLSECLQRRRRRCIYGPRELTTTMVASAEEYGTKESATTTEA